MNGTASAALSVITRPFARIPEAQRRRIAVVLLAAAALAFRIFAMRRNAISTSALDRVAPAG